MNYVPYSGSAKYGKSRRATGLGFRPANRGISQKILPDLQTGTPMRRSGIERTAFSADTIRCLLPMINRCSAVSLPSAPVGALSLKAPLLKNRLRHSPEYLRRIRYFGLPVESLHGFPYHSFTRYARSAYCHSPPRRRIVLF